LLGSPPKQLAWGVYNMLSPSTFTVLSWWAHCCLGLPSRATPLTYQVWYFCRTTAAGRGDTATTPLLLPFHTYRATTWT